MPLSHLSSLVPGPEVQAELHAFWSVYENNHGELEEVTRERMRREPAFAREMERMTTADIEERARGSLETARLGLVEGDWHGYIANCRELGIRYARAKVAFARWMEAASIFRHKGIEVITRECKGDQAKAAAAIGGLERYVDLGIAVIGESYMDEHELLIASQQAEIRELSTPILRMRDRLLVAPVVGVIDSHRARHLTESLLHAVRRNRARVIVLDITGVPIVDSKVASHLVQTVEAAGLMGARVVVSGISPEIAQTLVTIGASFGSVVTVGEFDVALVEATRMLQDILENERLMLPSMAGSEPVSAPHEGT